MECLQIGYEAPNNDLNDIKSQWIRYNHEQSKAVKAMTVDRRGGIYKSVCACAPKKNSKEWKENTICKAHIFVCKDKVSSVNLEHQCSNTDPGRKRQYSVTMMALASEEIRDYRGPTKERGTAMQKYTENARAAGFKMGRTQAYKVLQRINQDPIETHIGQYFLLTSVLKVWKRSDPGGTYEVDTTPSTWNDDLDAFRRAYLAPSFAKHAWKQCKTRFVTFNASFRTDDHFGHTVLLAVTYDANDNVILLAVSICDEESGENWAWFMQNLMRDYPGIQLVLSSSKDVMENPELEGLLNLIGAQRCWCIQRLVEECPMKVSKEDRASILNMAKASTLQLYNAYLQAFHKENRTVATWFDNRKQLFTTHMFLEAGKTRFGKVEDATANDTAIKKIIDSMQDKPVATMLSTCLAEWLQLHKDRKQTATQQQQEGSNSLCLGVSEDFKSIREDVVQHHVQPVFNKGGLWKAYVSFNKNDQPIHRMLVTVDTDSYQVKCPCQQGQEMGYPCVHSTALLLSMDIDTTDDTSWFHQRYHASTQLSIYNPASFPEYNQQGKLSIVEMAPPQHGRQTIKNKRRHYTPTPNSDAARICRACGDKGHHHKTCGNPSTRYQFGRFFETAKKWANEQEDLAALLSP